MHGGVNEVNAPVHQEVVDASAEAIRGVGVMGDPMMKQLALAFALLFAAAPARGVEPLPHYGNDLDRGYRVPMEIDRLAALLGDAVLRDMVCRLAHERYAFGNLSSALGLPEGQVMRRINTLRGWGLVRTVTGDHTIVEPNPGDGAQTLRRWANRYCSEGDSCGKLVADRHRPDNRRRDSHKPDNRRRDSHKPDSRRNERKESAVGRGGGTGHFKEGSAHGRYDKTTRGTVIWYDSAKGYGFIGVGRGRSNDVYVNKKAVESSGLSDLKEGVRVTFKVVPDWGGKLTAVNLAIADSHRPRNRRPDSQSKELKETAVSGGGGASHLSEESAPGGKDKGTRGTVKWYDSARGFGFIEVGGGSKDVYVHKSAVERSGLHGLKKGLKVIFDLVPSRGGKISANNLIVVE